MISDRTLRHMAEQAEDLLDVQPRTSIEPPTAEPDPWCARCRSRHPASFTFRGRMRPWHEGQR